MNSLPICRRGEIWMIDWNPHRGSEQRGWRPGVIVQSDLGNLALGARTTILVPLTTQGRPYLFYIPIRPQLENGLKAPSWANCTQILTIDKSRLVERLGQVTPEVMDAMGRALADTLDLA